MVAVASFSLRVFSPQVLRGDIPWDTYVTAKLITGTDLQLLRRYDHRSREVQSALLEEVCFCPLLDVLLTS